MSVSYYLNNSMQQSLSFLSWSRNLPDFMEPERLLSLSQETTTCPFPKPDQSSPALPTHFL
jgi:hypothetical protein